MQAEEAIEVERGSLHAARARDGDVRAGVVVCLLTVGNDDVQPVYGPALEDGHNDLLSFRRRRVGHTNEYVRKKSAADEREATGLEEGSAVHGGLLELVASC